MIPSDGFKPGDILIHTVFLNTPAVVSSVVNAVEPGVFTSPLSTIVATDPIRKQSIREADWLTLETTIINNSTSITNDLLYIVEVENPVYLYREDWGCNQCYATDDGMSHYCNGLWKEDGGFFYNTVSPSLAVCDETTPQAPAGYCIDTFPPKLDCAQTPSYAIDYNAPSDGNFRAWGNLPSLEPEQSFTAATGISGGFDIRTNYLARVAVTNATETLHEKFYIFDVIP